MIFCNYCKCEDCVHGTKYLHHAQTDRGDWICDVCWQYDQCTSGPNRNPNGPCDEPECEHRPKLISDWQKYEKV